MKRIPLILAARQGPAIWRGGRTKELELGFQGVGIRGYVTVELIHARTGLIKQKLEFPNLITDAGLDALAGTTIQISTFLASGYLAVGTGSTAPDEGDTGLASETGVRSNSVGGGSNSVGFGSSNVYSYYRITREFSESQSNGNLTEFGIFSASTAGTMLVRQLFRDSNGDPVTITKTSDDKLRIIYEFRIYPPSSDATGTANVSGTDYGWTCRTMNMGVDTAWGFGGSSTGLLNRLGASGAVGCTGGNHTTLGTTTSTTGPTGGSSTAAASSTSRSTYTSGTFSRDFSAIAEAGNWNFTNGVRSFILQPWGTSAGNTHQIVLDAFIPKLNTQRLTMNFSVSIGRH